MFHLTHLQVFRIELFSLQQIYGLIINIQSQCLYRQEYCPGRRTQVSVINSRSHYRQQTRNEKESNQQQNESARRTHKKWKSIRSYRGFNSGSVDINLIACREQVSNSIPVLGRNETLCACEGEFQTDRY